MVFAMLLNVQLPGEKELNILMSMQKEEDFMVKLVDKKELGNHMLYQAIGFHTK